MARYLTVRADSLGNIEYGFCDQKTYDGYIASGVITSANVITESMMPALNAGATSPHDKFIVIKNPDLQQV